MLKGSFPFLDIEAAQNTVCRSSLGKTDQKEKPWKQFSDMNSELAIHNYRLL